MDILEKTPFAKGDETKLPKWAQNELFKLRSRVNDLEQQLAIAFREAAAAGATGMVMADCLLADGFPLHDRARIKFLVGPRKYNTITCCLRQHGGKTVLDVNVQHGVLIINPQAANAANLTVGD